MKTFLISSLVLALTNVSLQFKPPPPYGPPAQRAAPVCRRVPSEVCEQLPRTKYETVARKQCQDVADTACSDVQERKCRITME